MTIFNQPIRLAPGRSGEIVWKFTNAGAFKIACLVPGHYDAGHARRRDCRTGNKSSGKGLT